MQGFPIAHGMSWRSVLFFLMSLCLHYLLLFHAWRHPIYLHGKIMPFPPRNSVPVTIKIRLVPPQLNGTPVLENEKVTIENSGKFTKFSDALPGEKYLSSSRLTKIPTPLDNVDLDEVRIKSEDISVTISLTILIDEHGFVADVLTPLQKDPRIDAFAKRVADRFRNTRFSPGEVNGNTVPSQIIITVVSEPLP